MIINRICETQNLLSLSYFLPGRAKDLSASLRIFRLIIVLLYIYIYIYSTNIPPIVIIKRIYEHQNFVAEACFLPGRAKDLSAPLRIFRLMLILFYIYK